MNASPDPFVAVVMHRDQPDEQIESLVLALRARGYDAEAVGVRELALHLSATGASVWRGDERFAPHGIITQGLNRSWTVISPILEVLERAGSIVVNPVKATSIALDKVATTARLIDAHVATLDLRMFPWGALTGDIAPFAGRLVTKPVRGSNGKGVLDAPDWQVARQMVARRRELGPDGLVGAELVQEFASGGNRDARVMVVNGDVVACVERRAREGFVATWPNADVEQMDNDEVRSTARDAVAALGLSYGGVDLVEHKGRWRVVDVNCWPRDLEVMGRFGQADVFAMIAQLVVR